MADKAISELTAATQVGSTDLFVLEQGNVAKKLTGQTLENWLLALAEAHGGIVSLEKTGTSGLVDTYTITFSDETTTTFTVTNGKGVASVTKTSAVAPSLTDTYTMTFTDNTSYQWTVTNGKGVSSIAKVSTSGLVDTYRITYNDATTSTFTVTNGKGVANITDKWAVSSSNTQTPSTWYNAAPEMTPTNKYLWHYSVIAYNDNTSVDTTKAVVGVYGDTGQNWYIWIKYAAQQPTRDADMTDNPSNWIGIYSGTSSTAPTSYTSYTWSQFKGDTGNGIASIAKTATSGLTDTYTVTFTDGDTFDFDVANGKSIVSVELTSTSGLTDTYTITFNDGTTTTFPVVNGRGIVSVSQPSTVGLVDTYTITYNDGTTSTFTVTNAKSITSVSYVSSSGLRDNYTINYNDGTTSSFYLTNGKGISTIAKTSTSGLTDTYTITFTDNTTSTFTVKNGSDIDSISKTSTSGLVDTYTVALSDGTSSTFTVTNGKGITSIELVSGTHAAGTTDTYRINFNDGDTTTFTVYNGANGEGAVSSVAGIGVVGDQGDVPLINWGNGAPTTSTAGYLKQLYFDISGGIMYICTGISGSTYTWASMGITVDSALSTSSTNPVRNSVISAKVGTGNLSGFSASDLTGAANELKTNKAEKTATVSTVTYDSTNHKLTKTINGTASDVMTVDALPTNGSNNPVTSDGVYDKLAEKAPLDSPEFINNPTAPTQNAQDSSTKLATTAFVQSHVSELNGAINNFRPNQLKRKWIFIGDSYGHASGTNQGWIDKLVPMLGLSSSDYYESAAGGYGFASQTLSFLSLLTNLSASITDKTAITDIVVLGGANDIAVTAESISTAIETFNTYAYTNYPNATVRIGMIAGCADQTKIGTQYSRTKEGYSNCGKAQYLNNLEFVFQNRDYIGADNIHPTATGYEVLTKKIYEALNGGCNVIYRDFGQIVPPDGFALTTTESFYNVIVNNGITNITIANRPGVVTTDSAKYFNVQAQNAIIPIGTLPTKLILSESIGQYNVLTSTAMQVKIRSTVNNQIYLVSGFCFISGRTIYFRPVDPAVGGSSAYTSCDLIEASSISFSAASIMC